MFKKLYLAVDSKVEPNLDLINNTKNKMYEELKKRNKVRTMNFYKYASIAACLVIFIGVLSVNQKINQPIQESNSFMESTNIKPSVNNSGSTGNPFNSAFDSTTSAATSSSVLKSESFFDKIIDFFTSIIQWFKELLF